MMADVYDASEPTKLQNGQWHLPLTGFPGDETLSLAERIKVCIGRCARVSYETHDGRRDVSADLALHGSLEGNGHWSPFEHAAQADSSRGAVGNFTGWVQSRKTYGNEFIPG
jgi:hypothetical protein